MLRMFLIATTIEDVLYIPANASVAQLPVKHGQNPLSVNTPNNIVVMPASAPCAFLGIKVS